MARIKYNTVLKPHSATICYAKVRPNPDLPVRVDYHISAVEEGFICREPGLEVVDSVSRLGKDRSIPICVTNSTGKLIRIRRHWPRAKIEQLTGHGLVEVISVIKGQKFGSRMDLKDLHVSDKHKDNTEPLILKNSDLFAKRDTELGHRDTVRMKMIHGWLIQLN